MSTRTAESEPWPGFLDSEFDQGKETHSLFHILPVPYEQTVSYGKGTAHGPLAILLASRQLESFDGTGFPGEDGFFTHPPVVCGSDTAAVYGRIENAVTRILGFPHPEGSKNSRFRKIPVVLGGEHSITFPVLRAAAARFGAERIGVVQFDAHADLRDSYEGTRFSHACVMRRVHADLGIPVLQIGVRALCPEELFYRNEHDFHCRDARDIVPDGIRSIELPEDFPELVYISFDVDGLDPSIMPATGTPVPGGLGWYQALGIVDSITAQRRIIGFDVVELAPIPGLAAPDFLAADLAHKIMGMIGRRKISNPLAGGR